MTTKSDWHAVPQNMTAEERRKLGEPPANEELIAYSHGELAGADAERVRTWLDANPDMARALDQPFPEDDAKPGDPDYLPEEELSLRWSALQKEIHPPKGRVVRFPVWVAALAASIAIVVAGLYWHERSIVRSISRPQPLDVTQVFDPENGRRGTSVGPYLMNLTKDSVVATLQLSDPTRFQWYEVEIADARSAKEIWTTVPMQPQDGGLSLLIQRNSLEPGTYRFKVWGLNEAGREQVDSYLVRVPSP